MVEAGYATPAEAAAAKADPVTVRHREEAEIVTGAYFAEEVRRQLLVQLRRKGGLPGRPHRAHQPRRAAAGRRRQVAARGADRLRPARGGWRGVVDHIDPTGDWPATLAAQPLPAGAATVGWQLAMVTGTPTPTGAHIGFADGSTGRIPFERDALGPAAARRRHDRRRRRATPPTWSSRAIWCWSSRWRQRRPSPSPASPSGGKDAAADQQSGDDAGRAVGPVRGIVQSVPDPDISGALVSIDPHTGRVLAMSGGFSFEISQFNRATQAKRQPGSSIKPFVYLTALEHGYTPSTLVLDAPISLPQGPGLPMWSPSNYSTRTFNGPTPLSVALEKSLNTVSARLGATFGMDAMADTIETFGIMDHMPREYSMVLGAGETTPLRHTTAYAMLANGGKKLTPTLIDSVQDRNGVTIFRADQRACTAAPASSGSIRRRRSSPTRASRSPIRLGVTRSSR